MTERLPRPEGLDHADLVDIGVNLTAPQFEHDLPSVLQRARAAGVVRQLVTGTDLPHSRQAMALSSAHPGELFATAGVHPHAAGSVPPNWRRQLGALLADPDLRAAGETGLDFNRDYSPRPDQEAVFIAQLELAAEYRKPVFLHERDSQGRFFELLEPLADDLAGGVLHCFTGSERDLDRALEAGLHIGITGWICDERRGASLQELAKRIPAERLMIETDAPWLLPRTLRPRPKSRRNEPGLLPWVLATLAVCRDEDPMDTARLTTANACRLFDLPLP